MAIEVGRVPKVRKQRTKSTIMSAGSMRPIRRCPTGPMPQTRAMGAAKMAQAGDPELPWSSITWVQLAPSCASVVQSRLNAAQRASEKAARTRGASASARSTGISSNVVRSRVVRTKPIACADSRSARMVAL